MTDVQSLLDDTLTECQPIVSFAKADDFAGGRPATQLNICDSMILVDLYTGGGEGVVTINYVAGMCIADTAYCGGVEEAHKAIVRVARHTECEVVNDEFDILSADGTSGQQ